MNRIRSYVVVVVATAGCFSEPQTYVPPAGDADAMASADQSLGADVGVTIDAVTADLPALPPPDAAPSKLANGRPCDTPAQCQSGFCVDQLCCDSPCTGKCVSCAASKTTGPDGTCTPTRPNTDPDNDCPPETCTGATHTPAARCDGTDKCGSAPTRSCGSYVCGPTTCKTTCSAHSDCAGGYYCAGTACAGKKAGGEPCVESSECGSSACTDRRCCTQSCSVCQNCTGPAGTCTNLPRYAADNTPPMACDGARACDGRGSCKKLEGQSCAGHSECVGYCPPGNVCSCGESSGPCCQGGLCKSTGLYCHTEFDVCLECGRGGQPCCPGSACAGSTYCDRDLVTCIACGRLGERCCPNSPQCSTGSCVNSTCSM